jgi:signal transduction histidine kinase
VIAAVRTMLDSSSASAGRLELNYHDFDLADLLKDVVQRLKPLVEKSGTHIHLQADTPIFGQWDQFKMSYCQIWCMAFRPLSLLIARLPACHL